MNKSTITLEAVITEASKYSIRKDFHKNSRAYYNWATKNGLLDEVCLHMKKPRRKIVISLDELKIEASKYKTKKEFMECNPTLHRYAKNNGLLVEICQHMVDAAIKWSLDAIKEEARKYKSRSELQKLNSGCYQVAKARGILDEVCLHMKAPRSSSPQKICQQIFDTILNSKCVYNDRKTVRPFELDLYYPHLKLAIEYSPAYWHDRPKAIERDAKKAALCKLNEITLIVLPGSNVCNENEIKEQIITKLEIINKVTSLGVKPEHILDVKIDYESVYYYYDIMTVDGNIDEVKIKELIDNSESVLDFINKYPYYYRQLTSIGRLDVLKSIKKMRDPYTVEEIIELCGNITTYKEFTSNNRLYLAAIRRGILEEVSSHMIKTKRKPFTEEELMNAVNECKNVIEFRRKYPSLYKKAKRKNIINKLFSEEDVQNNESNKQSL